LIFESVFSIICLDKASRLKKAGELCQSILRIFGTNYKRIIGTTRLIIKSPTSSKITKNFKPKPKMQFRNIFLLLLTGLLLFAAENVLAQKITTNENGDKIILYPDGSWRYFDSRLDNPPNEKTVEQHVEKNNSGESDRDQVIKDYRVLLIKAAERAVAEEKYTAQNYEDVQFDRILIEEELEEVVKSSDATKSEINEIKQRLKEAKEKEKEALENLNIASNAAKEAEEKTAMSDEDIYDLIFVNNEPATSRNNAGNTKKSSSRSNSGKKKVFVSFDPKDDVMVYPPKRKCRLTFDGVDDFSGKKRKEVAKATLFSHTSDEMRPYLKDRDYMICEAYLSSLSGGYKFLTLEITIASDHAQRDYGIIEKGSILNIKLMDETNVKLFNNKTDIGILDELKNSVTYTAQYIISSGAEKILRKNEIDKVRVIWSSGYEDYEVYDLDFFINQFRCLNQK
jgi:hypothetical protein